MRTAFLFSMFLFFGIICKAQKAAISVDFPKLNEHLNYYSPNYKREVSPRQMGVAKPGDSFDSIKFPRINVEVTDKEDSIANQYNKQKEELTVTVDVSQEISQDVHFYQRFKYKRYFSVPKNIRFVDKKDTVSIPLINDTTIAFRAMPVYIANLTNDDIIIGDVGGTLDIVEEAQDKNKKWVAIERLNGHYFSLAKGYTLLHPKQFLVTGILKYKGNYKTKLRVRYTVKGQSFYSQPFTGSINYKQIRNSNIRKFHNEEYEL